jgi:hypothetical protein
MRSRYTSIEMVTPVLHDTAWNASAVKRNVFPCRS